MNFTVALLPRRRRAIGVICLAVYLLGGAQIVPGLLALAARLEGTHEVLVGCPDSEFELILHHPTAPTRLSGRAMAACQHRHGLASRVICMLGSPDDSDPDHVLHLANGSVCEDPWHRLALSPPKAVLAGTLAGTRLLWAIVGVPVPTAVASPVICNASESGQGPGGHLPELRVTVLLI